MGVNLMPENRHNVGDLRQMQSLPLEEKIMKDEKICAWCWYARDRKDICGVYCTKGFENPDGTCDHFLDYWKHKRGEKHKVLR